MSLSPCPFCGGEASILRNGSRRVSMQICCDDCGAMVESGDVFGLTDPERYAWNRRASRDSIIEECAKVCFEVGNKIMLSGHGHKYSRAKIADECADLVRLLKDKK